ncbi:MAG: sugar ABC transporter ATP-binding protein [Planctomycetota bacterium]
MSSPPPSTAERAPVDGTGALLELRGVQKTYPGVRALDGVDFDLRAREIHGLMGENGAGKSTLIRIVTGAEPRDAGTVRLRGRPVAPRTPLEAQRLGISTVYQEINLVPQLSVAENLCLGRQPTRRGRIDWRALRRDAVAALSRLELDLDVDRPLGACSIALQQLVAIARALAISADVLILDEPTSSLDDQEVERLFALMRRLRDDGLGIVFVTHFIDQVYAVADRVTVLRNGKRVGTWDAAGLPRLRLVQAMIGREITAPARESARGPAPTSERPALLSVRGLGRRRSVGRLHFDIGRGEVVALAGLLGSGRTECARLLFGLDRPDRGEVRVAGRRRAIRSPRQAIALGFGYLAEDRQHEGIMPGLSVRENIVLAVQARRGWWRPLRRRAQQRLVRQFMETLRIAAPDAERPIRALSGGNQQKALVARWLLLQPDLLILDEPTRGIDVGAKLEIERLVGELRSGGKALLLISSELEELARDADRVVVLRDREQVAELGGDALSVERIMGAIAGGAP